MVVNLKGGAVVRLNVSSGLGQFDVLCERGLGLNCSESGHLLEDGFL